MECDGCCYERGGEKLKIYANRLQCVVVLDWNLILTKQIWEQTETCLHKQGNLNMECKILWKKYSFFYYMWSDIVTLFFFFFKCPYSYPVVTQDRSPSCPGRVDLLKEWVGPLLGKDFLWLLNSLGNSSLSNLLLDVIRPSLLLTD